MLVKRTVKLNNWKNILEIQDFNGDYITCVSTKF